MSRRDGGRDVEGDLLAAHLRSALHLSQEEKEVRGRESEWAAAGTARKEHGQ